MRLKKGSCYLKKGETDKKSEVWNLEDVKNILNINDANADNNVDEIDPNNEYRDDQNRIENVNDQNKNEDIAQDRQSHRGRPEGLTLVESQR